MKKRILALVTAALLCILSMGMTATATTAPKITGTLLSGKLTVTVTGLGSGVVQVNIVAVNQTAGSPDLDAVTQLPVATIGTIQVGQDNDTIEFNDRKGSDYKVMARLKTADGKDGADLTPVEIKAPGVTYSAHVQSIGWQPFVKDGVTAGTFGRSLRVEALKINLTGSLPKGASIIYQAHVQKYGWMKPVSGGVTAGTFGKSLKVEALKITLSGLPGYQVTYRVHQQTYSWSGWKTAKDGTDISVAAQAGITGKSKRLEAVEIKIEQIPSN